MHNLHALDWSHRPATKNGKFWCVPSALSVLTGLPYATCTEACVRNGAASTYEDLEAVAMTQIVLALRDLVPTATVTEVDLAARFPDLKAGPTLRRYMAERDVDETVYPLLISVNTHLIAGHRGWLGGNDVKRPCPVSMFPQLTRNVNWVGVVRGLP